MNLCRCERGHFYDKEKFPTCPHCAAGAVNGGAGDITEAFPGDNTVPVSGDPVRPDTEAQAVPFDLPPENGLPVAGMGADQVTVPLELSGAEIPTVPLFSGEDADDITVGFFDDAFPPATDTHKKQPFTPGQPVQPVNRVSTPCVGWLVALGGEHIGTDFRLKVGKNFVGRSPKMDIALTEDKSVSRDRHAILVYEPKAHLYLVQPGESSSLVYCNNEVVLTPVKLQAYDMITVGDVNLLFIPLCGDRFNWGTLFEEMKKKEN